MVLFILTVPGLQRFVRNSPMTVIVFRNPGLHPASDVPLEMTIANLEARYPTVTFVEVLLYAGQPPNWTLEFELPHTFCFYGCMGSTRAFMYDARMPRRFLFNGISQMVHTHHIAEGQADSSAG